MAAVKLNDYEVIETIGLGYFGYRKKVARKADGQLFEWQQIDYRFLDDCVKEVSFKHLFSKIFSTRFCCGH